MLISIQSVPSVTAAGVGADGVVAVLSTSVSVLGTFINVYMSVQKIAKVNRMLIELKCHAD